MALHTSLDDVRDGVREHIERTLSPGESFVAAMPTADRNPFVTDYIPWYALTTHRLIRFQDILWNRDVSEFRLSEINRVETSSTFRNQKWAISGPGIYEAFKTYNDSTDEFVDRLREELSRE